MVLTKKQILERIENKELSFTPMLDKFQLQPHAVDLRLGKSFHLPKSWEMTKKGRVALHIDPLIKDATNFEKIELNEGQYFELLPGEYVIASTLEMIELNANDLMGVLYPRSSITRRGLAVNLTGIIDVHYSGYLMIPILNNTQNQIIRVYPGERICSVVLEELSSAISSKEARQHGLKEAKYNNNKVGFIGGKTDREDETDLIAQGKLNELKEKYKI